jgi:hypothetical protein
LTDAEPAHGCSLAARTLFANSKTQTPRDKEKSQADTHRLKAACVLALLAGNAIASVNAKEKFDQQNGGRKTARKYCGCM